MDHAVQKTPEREAFYRKIDGENLYRVVERDGRPDHAGAEERAAGRICGASTPSATT